MAGEGEKRPTFFVAVHVGAGFHAHSSEKSFRKTMKCACRAAASVLLKVRLKVSHAKSSSLKKYITVSCSGIDLH